MERLGAYTITHQDGLKETHIYYRGSYPEVGNIVNGITGTETEVINRNYIPNEFKSNGSIRCDLCDPFTRCRQVDDTHVEIDQNGYKPFTIRGDVNDCTKFRNFITKEFY